MAIRIRRKRRQKPTAFRIHKPVWRDPYPWIAGTEPEKRLFQVLIMHRFYFVFQDSLEEWKQGQFSTLSVPQFIPDFVLPRYKVILDPFSDFHHLLPDAVERDAWKAAVYESMGYRFYHPWSSEVIKYGGEQILRAIPELWMPPKYELPARDIPFQAQGYRLGPFVGIGSTSVAAANRRRRRAPSLSIAIRR